MLKKVQSCQNNLEKSYTEKIANMSLLVGQCLKDAHLIKSKINLIAIEEKIVLKNYAKKTKESVNEIINRKKRNDTINR